jgi:WD40 repeat protein
LTLPPRLDWPVRTLSFSHDGKMLASASEDHFIDIAEVETGESSISTALPLNDLYINIPFSKSDR